MSDDDAEADHDHHDHEDHDADDHSHADHDGDAIERQTAPQGEYSMRDVGVGFGVALAGMALVFLVPFLLA